MKIVGITRGPCGSWMAQIGGNLTDFEAGFLRCLRCLILDRDPLCTEACRKRLGRMLRFYHREAA